MENFDELLQSILRKNFNGRVFHKVLSLKHGIDPDTIARMMAEGPDKAIKEFINCHYSKLLPFVAKMIGRECNELEKHPKEISLKPIEKDPTVNGQTDFNGEDFTITINLPLMIFFSKMAKLWATRIQVMEITGYSREDSKVPFDKTVNIANNLMTAFCAGNICKAEVMPMRLLNQSQFRLAEGIVHYGSFFVIAHELGHVVIHLAPNSVSDFIDWANLVTRSCFYPILSKYVNWSEKEFVRNWGEEYAADLIGLHLALTAAGDELERVWIYWCAELVFVTFSMLENFYSSKGFGRGFTMTDHPFFFYRLAVLRKGAEESIQPMPSGVLEIGKNFEKMGNEILKKLGISTITHD